MSIKIKLTSNLGGHKAGDTIDVTPNVAEYLIDNEHAEASKARVTKKTEDSAND